MPAQPEPDRGRASGVDAAVEEQLAVFRRGSVDLIDEAQLARRIAQSLASGTPLRLKLGVDPSSSDLHVGHSIPLFKLRELQDRFDHQVVLILGTATAMVGDPSGRNKLRPQLTREQVEQNVITYQDQAALVLDMERTEVRRNSEWFDALDFEGLLRLCARMTVAQMIERDTFQERMQASEPIGIHEFLYPLMQGWDSVEVRADVEFGGTDQLFNLLVGRRFQEQEGQTPQVCLTTPLIEGLDGRKMSKSYGNAVGLTDDARTKFFAIMRVEDGAMPTWFECLTRLAPQEISSLVAAHPREAKARLAEEVTSFYHGPDEARAARQAFDRQVRDKQLPDDIPEEAWPDPNAASLPLANLLKAIGLCSSTSDARRVIDQGGVRLGGEVVQDPMHPVPRPSAPLLVQVGKKRIAHLR